MEHTAWAPKFMSNELPQEIKMQAVHYYLMFFQDNGCQTPYICCMLHIFSLAYNFKLILLSYVGSHFTSMIQFDHDELLSFQIWVL